MNTRIFTHFALIALAGSLDAATKLYWADSTRAGIYCSDLDGSNATELISTIGTPGSLTSDGTYLYWTNSIYIYRADLDGGNVGIHVDPGAILGAGPLENGLRVPGGLLVADNALFWTDVFQDGLFRTNLDGSGTIEVLNFVQDLPPLLGGNYAVPDLAEAGGLLYWPDLDTDTIVRATTNGASPTTLVTGGITNSYGGIAVAGSNIFWADALNGVSKSDLSGGGEVEIITRTELGGGLIRRLTVFGSNLFITVDGVAGSTAEGVFKSDLNGDGLVQIVDLHVQFPAAHGNGPRGIITVTPPGEVPVLEIELAPLLRFQTEVGKSYSVRASDTAEGPFVEIGLVTGDGGEGTFTDERVLSTKQFYRVLILD